MGVLGGLAFSDERATPVGAARPTPGDEDAYHPLDGSAW
jgi:hypothetical protein